MSSDRDDTYAEGMEVRRAVLGDAHVDRAVENTTPFTADFQDFITRYAWGEIWSRPGLDRRTRSLLNLAMISCLNRPHELRLHIAGALTNGVSREEIREVFMQVAIYAGVPAGVDSFRIAREVFAELDKG